MVVDYTPDDEAVEDDDADGEIDVADVVDNVPYGVAVRHNSWEEEDDHDDIVVAVDDEYDEDALLLVHVPKTVAVLLDHHSPQNIVMAVDDIPSHPVPRAGQDDVAHCQHLHSLLLYLESRILRGEFPLVIVVIVVPLARPFQSSLVHRAHPLVMLVQPL